MPSSQDRVIFCPGCQAVTPAAHQRRSGCDAELSRTYQA